MMVRRREEKRLYRCPVHGDVAVSVDGFRAQRDWCPTLDCCLKMELVWREVSYEEEKEGEEDVADLRTAQRARSEPGSVPWTGKFEFSCLKLVKYGGILSVCVRPDGHKGHCEAVAGFPVGGAPGRR